VNLSSARRFFLHGGPDAGSAAGRPGRGLARTLPDRLRHGDVGVAPALLGLVLIAAVFQAANPHFLTPLNLTNLMVQIASVGAMATGIVLVLLLGEIDLSIGAVSGFSAAIMAVLAEKHGLPGAVAVLAALAAGGLIGLFQGWWIARLQVPSFVVTLAGYVGWQGALLWILGSTGTINLSDPFVTGIANTLWPTWAGWCLAGLALAALAANGLADRRRRARAGLAPRPWAWRAAAWSGLALLAVLVMSVNRNPRRDPPIVGVPSGVVILVALVVLFDVLTRRTRFGRYIFAVGGGAEAARRAGIAVERIRIAVFGLASALAAAGGILAGSRLYAVNQSSGGGDVLLNAIAAAVIGGTSLFGGRGSTWSALLGAVIIGAIANGMDLLAFASSVRFMITGAVLLVAVTLDSYARRRRAESGR